MRLRRKASRIWWLGGISIAFCLLVLLTPPVILKSAKAAPRTEALNNIKQIGMLLFEFDNEYGSFPDTDTAIDVKEETKTPLTLGNHSSNQLFRQLLVGCGPGTGERPFWAKTAHSRKKPDNIFTTDATALARGECAFGYIAGLSSSGDPSTPVVFTPVVRGKHLFDPDAFNGFAIILHLDNSARPLPIDKHGHVIVNGMDIFDPRQPFWHGKSPDVKWPE